MAEAATAQAAALTAEERALIKDAILASVRSGAHGNMDPASLAESLIAAFNSLVDDAKPEPAAATFTGLRNIEVREDGGLTVTSASMSLKGQITREGPIEVGSPTTSSVQQAASPSQSTPDSEHR